MFSVSIYQAAVIPDIVLIVTLKYMNFVIYKGKS